MEVIQEEKLEVNRFILAQLSEDIYPAYFGNFIETIIAEMYDQGKLFNIKINIKPGILNSDEIKYIHNKNPP